MQPDPTLPENSVPPSEPPMEPSVTDPVSDAPPPEPIAQASAQTQGQAPSAPVKQADEMFCPSCGKVIKREAEICVNCGVRVRKPASQTGGKSKIAAILLAVFLGFWTWLYTYKVDGWKFWLGLGVSIVTLGLAALGFWIWAIIDAASRSDDWYISYE